MTLKYIIETDLTQKRKDAFKTTQTLDTYREYYSVLDKSAQEVLKQKMIDKGYTFAQGGVYKDGNLLFNKDTVTLDLDAIIPKQDDDNKVEIQKRIEDIKSANPSVYDKKNNTNVEELEKNIQV